MSHHQRPEPAPRAVPAAVHVHDHQWTLALQEACDEVYCSPFDPAAHARLRELLERERGVFAGAAKIDDVHSTSRTGAREWIRTLRIACDELHDGPDDPEAQDRLLVLLSGSFDQR